MKTTIIRCVLVAVALAGSALADDTPTPTGNFFSSLKQSFRQDYDHEVVRGHFDLGTPPNSHRYYCLVDPKTGKVEANGMAGTPTPRPDGMTGIQGAVVSFYSCSDAESKGLLATSDYRVTIEAPSKVPPPVSTSVPQNPVVKASTTDPMATLRSFIGLYNRGDGTALAALLIDSGDFAWVQPDGNMVWGRRDALEALRATRAAGAELQLQSEDGHTISPSSNTAILVIKLRLSQTSQDARMIRCSGVVVQTAKGWRIASLFMTPELS